MKFKIIAVLLLALCQVNTISQASELTDLSLEELMDIKVKVATGTDKPLREAPGIISVITDSQIKSMGARDLMEILQTVPGITFGQDVLGNISSIIFTT